MPLHGRFPFASLEAVTQVFNKSLCERLKWCDAFFVDKYTIDMNGVKIYPYKGILTSLDIYALRCSMLHEGKDYVGGQPAHKMIEKFLFCVSQKNYIHCNMTKGKLNFDIIHFCNDMCNFVTSWLIDYPTKLEIDIVHEIFCL